MAKLVKSIIGGITFKVTGGEVYESEEEDTLPKEGQKEDILEEEEEEDKEGSTEGGEERKSFSTSDEEEAAEDTFHSHQPLCKMATLSKWTNYLSGWQDRYVVVRDGILSYYKSEIDLQYGCRGSISLHKVKVFIHEFDELRFDIRAHDSTYFFRANGPEEKSTWVEIIEANKTFILENGPKSSITRPASIISLSGLSQASTSSFKTGHDLQVKLAEMETYRDILCKQIDVLQAFFDIGIETSSNNGVSEVINSTESIDEIPEDSDKVVGRRDHFHNGQQHLSTPSSPLTRSNDSHRSFPDGGSSSTNNSPSAGRLAHRRTGSDPFAFRQIPHHLHSRSPHLRHTIGGAFVGSGGNCPPLNLSGIDFRGEAITFKATTAGILSSMKYCIDIMSKREEYWQKKFEKEQERRRKADRAAHSALNGPRIRAYEYAGPDFQEGPHSALNEDEFFDALEMAYREDELEVTSTSGANSPIRKNVQDKKEEAANLELIKEIQHKPFTGPEHKLTPLINDHVSKYSKYVFESVDSCDGTWQLAHEDGDMKVYRRELEEDGVVVDPLKAHHVVKGLTALEMCKYFFAKDTRLDWEGTVESFNVLETLSEDSIIFHQLHKRVWPSTQRETVFCSHLCMLSNVPQPENMLGHTWMVCNFSMDHASVPVTSKMIRATLNVGLVCQTISSKPIEVGKESEVIRDDVACKMIYAANVNPGGWAPPSVVRTIAKREITKFLKKISGCAQKAILEQPLTL